MCPRNFYEISRKNKLCKLLMDFSNIDVTTQDTSALLLINVIVISTRNEGVPISTSGNNYDNPISDFKMLF